MFQFNECQQTVGQNNDVNPRLCGSIEVEDLEISNERQVVSYPKRTKNGLLPPGVATEV
jgi:hypothetical protein